MARKEKRIRFGVQIRPGPIARLVDQAVVCEKSGFDSVWWMDHFVGGPPSSTIWPELFTSLAMMGDKTKRIYVGSAVTDTLRRHPATIAQTCATIQHITGGRLILGLGAGEAMNLVPFGIPMDNSFSRLREAIKLMRLLWSKSPVEPVDFIGDHYSLKNAFLQIRSEYPTPIYLGAFGPKMLRLTGELGDGWLPWSQTPETYKMLFDSITTRSSRTPDITSQDFEPCSINIASISNDTGESRKVALPNAKQMLGILPDQVKRLAPDLEHPGYGFSVSGTMGPLESKERLQTMARFVESIPDEVALKTAIYGTPDECIQKIEKLASSGCGHFILSVRGNDTDQVIRDYGEKVIPYFRETRRPA